MIYYPDTKKQLQMLKPTGFEKADTNNHDHATFFSLTIIAPGPSLSCSCPAFIGQGVQGHMHKILGLRFPPSCENSYRDALKNVDQYQNKRYES
jgi:hypothetical protein